MPDPTRQRLAFIDWMRGFACLVMFQTHCYDSWLNADARKTAFFSWSQLGGTLPAPLFLFVAGISSALVTDRARQKGVSANDIARKAILRGVQILGLGILFRVQEFVLGLPKSPWTDLLRVDILNMIGISMILMGAACWFVRSRLGNGILAAAIAAGITLATPLIWNTERLRWIPWYIETYLNGVHVFKQPQAWLFPIFPWAAFAFAGLAVGFLLLGARAMQHPAQATAICGAIGAALFALAIWGDLRPGHAYAVYDYWHTSPNFLLARVGVMMMFVFLSYAWCEWGAGRRGFSPLIQLGQTSLLIYWVHIEFVYGRFSILPKHQQTIPVATLGFAAIFVAMLLLSMARTRWKGRGKELRAWFRREREPRVATAN